MIIQFLSCRYLSHFCIFISVLSALLLFSIEKFNLFSAVRDVSLKDLREQKSISITTRVYQTGECKIQLYGWTHKDPGTTDAADQYFEIRRLNATLDSKLITAKNDKYDGAGINEHGWTVSIPTRGLLKIIIEEYETPKDDLWNAYFHLDCGRPWTKIAWLSLLAISILSGALGLILVLAFCVRKLMRTPKP
jgi:hypothetical protein